MQGDPPSGRMLLRGGCHRFCKHAEKVRAGQAGKARLRAVPADRKPAAVQRTRDLAALASMYAD
jgi:hypothetical protein